MRLYHRQQHIYSLDNLTKNYESSYRKYDYSLKHFIKEVILNFKKKNNSKVAKTFTGLDKPIEEQSVINDVNTILSVHLSDNNEKFDVIYFNFFFELTL